MVRAECIRDTREDGMRFELTIGEKYMVVDTFEEGGEEYVELEYNDAGEPCTIYKKSFFIIYEPLDELEKICKYGECKDEKLLKGWDDTIKFYQLN